MALADRLLIQGVLWRHQQGRQQQHGRQGQRDTRRRDHLFAGPAPAGLMGRSQTDRTEPETGLLLASPVQGGGMARGWPEGGWPDKERGHNETRET